MMKILWAVVMLLAFVNGVIDLGRGHWQQAALECSMFATAAGYLAVSKIRA